MSTNNAPESAFAKVIDILVSRKRGQLIPLQRVQDRDLVAFVAHPKEIVVSHGAVTCGRATRILLERPDTGETMMTRMLDAFTPMRVWREVASGHSGANPDPAQRDLGGKSDEAE